MLMTALRNSGILVSTDMSAEYAPEYPSLIIIVFRLFAVLLLYHCMHLGMDRDVDLQS